MGFEQLIAARLAEITNLAASGDRAIACEPRDEEKRQQAALATVLIEQKVASMKVLIEQWSEQSV